MTLTIVLCEDVDNQIIVRFKIMDCVPRDDLETLLNWPVNFNWNRVALSIKGGDIR